MAAAAQCPVPLAYGCTTGLDLILRMVDHSTAEAGHDLVVVDAIIPAPTLCQCRPRVNRLRPELALALQLANQFGGKTGRAVAKMDRLLAGWTASGLGAANQ